MASNKPKKEQNDSKVFDVAKPGKSAPSASAKPIIISNRPILKDPMMSDETAGALPVAEKTQATQQSSPKLSVAPIAESDKPPEAAPKPADTAEATTTDDSLPTGQSPAPEDTKPEEVPKDKPAEAAAPASDNKTDKSPNQPQTPEEQAATQAAKDKAAEEHAAAIQKLVDSKDYFLPINSVEKRKTQHFVLIGIVLILVLGLAWLDIALDAGLIRLGGVKALTHFFRT